MGKLDHRVVSENRTFWWAGGPRFSEKVFHKEHIILNNEKLEEIFNKYFSKPVENLDIHKTLAKNIASSGITDPIFNLLLSSLLLLLLLLSLFISLI